MSTENKTDEELMRSFQSGNLDAFEALYQKYKSSIFSFLSRQYVDRDHATDLTQEVFIRVIRGALTFHHDSRFSTWIFTIARNLAIDTVRRDRHRRHVPLDKKIGHDGPPLVERLAGEEPAPDRASTGARLRADLAEAISKLPDEQREVFLLREYHGLRFDEISKVLGAKVGTVKSRMRYALLALRRELSDYHDYARTLA